MEMAKVRIKNENLRVFTVGYLQVGEYCVDKGLYDGAKGHNRKMEIGKLMETVSIFNVHRVFFENFKSNQRKIDKKDGDK
jgi:hypothetical protein